MSLPHDTISALADELIEAELRRTPVAPLTTRYTALTKDDAYHIQQHIVAQKVQQGAKIIGVKVGATNPGVGLLKADEPLYGNILDRHRVMPDSIVTLSDFIDLRVECEIGFVLRESLRGPRVTAADVLNATDTVFAALELNDTRIRDWQVTMFDVIADSAVIAGVVLSEQRLAVASVDLPGEGVRLYRNRELFGEATGAAVLGHPAEAVAWAANKLVQEDRGLNAGDVIISGSLTPLMTVQAGDRVEAVFDTLGRVAITIG